MPEMFQTSNGFAEAESVIVALPILFHVTYPEQLL
jgi:hypothetical protein